MKYLQVFLQYRGLLSELVSREIKIKYRRSVLGLLWTLLNPLLMMLILTIVFSNLFRFEIQYFPVYLMCGQLVFNFFSEATTGAMAAIVGNAGLIKKVYCPKYLFPMSKVFATAVNLVASTLALFIVMLIIKMPLHWTALLLPIPILYLLLFSTGVGILLSALLPFFRDLTHLYGVLLTAWMYLTPIFYPLEILPDFLKSLMRFNPLANMAFMFRNVLMYGQVPTIGLHLGCLLPGLVCFALGAIVFYKRQSRFILYV